MDMPGVWILSRYITFQQPQPDLHHLIQEIRRVDHTFSPRGEGNVVSVEFNLLYRWHATLSRNDTEWVQNAFRQLFSNHGSAEVT